MKRRKRKLGRIKRHQKGRRTERQRGTTENEKQLPMRTPKLRGRDRLMQDPRFAQHWIVKIIKVTYYTLFSACFFILNERFFKF